MFLGQMSLHANFQRGADGGWGGGGGAYVLQSSIIVRSLQNKISSKSSPHALFSSFHLRSINNKHLVDTDQVCHLDWFIIFAR